MEFTNFVLLVAAILIIAGLMLALMSLTKKGTKHLDVEKYRVKCLAIEQQLKRDEVSSYHLAVMNADKLLDQALQERGMRGKTMGERMKAANSIFTDNNGVWSAHKLRNRIAHESDVMVRYDDARYALANFRKALKDLGAI